MGAFFLYHRNSKIAKNLVDKLYELKGFKSPFRVTIGDYNLMLFRKQIVDIVNHFQIERNYIFATGSLFYKGRNYIESLKNLLSDFINNCVDSQNLYGNYVIIFYNGIKKQITFCIDPAFIKNVYYDPDKKIITSDFLALIEAFPKAYSLNKIAVIENLITGNLISPDTYAKEIQKLDRVNFISIETNYTGIKVQVFKPELVGDIHNFNSAIKNANDLLSNYFKSVKNLTEEFGAHIGLTGGFDSRLLLMHAKKHLKRLVTNSFWRGNSIEYFNAKQLAKVANVDFFSFEEDTFIKPGNEVMLKNSFYFFDGQIRSQNNWEEEFNLSDYTFRIASNHFVGFHGCGGEQYRNADRLIKKISLKTFIQHEWMFKKCSNVFIDKKLKNRVYENIENKVRRLVDIQINKVGLNELKKIQNEIWNKSNRATRLNVLNQQQFYFAPFTEYQLSMAAYFYVPFLGNSLTFQIEMMKELDMELSGVPTNYGFNLLRGESFKYKFIPYIFNIVPRFVFYSIYHKLKNTQSNKFQIGSFIKTAHPFFHSVTRKLDLEKIGNNKELGNGLNSFDYLLKNTTLENKHEC